MEIEHIVIEQDIRLDSCITQLVPFSRVIVAEAIRGGLILVNGTPVTKCSYRVSIDEKITGMIQDPSEHLDDTCIPENVALDIYYEDSDMVVLHKPKGWVTHPGHGHPTGTLLNALVYHYPSMRGLPKHGLVQRLDKDTSGLMIVAISHAGYQALLSMMLSRKITRQYLALVWGRPPVEATIDAPLGRHAQDRTLRAITPTGRPAITHIQTLAYGKWGSKVLCTLETGRTHQIRVHMKHLGYPICGDLSYGLRHPPCRTPDHWTGQALHAHRLSLTHPFSGEFLDFQAPTPEGWASWEDLLELQYDQS